MTAITRGERAFFAIVALSALWIGSWCYVIPAYVQIGMPWNAPPLHARFLGAIYLSATTFCFCSAFARTHAQLRAVLPMIAIWTGVVLVVSFFYLTQADYLRVAVWIWLIAYLVYPLIALRLMWIHRTALDQAATYTLPGWAHGYLLAQGILLSAAAALLLLQRCRRQSRQQQSRATFFAGFGVTSFGVLANYPESMRHQRIPRERGWHGGAARQRHRAR
jgi:hypothetical protein